MAAVDDDDLITNDEIHVPAPLGIDFNERRGNRYNPDAGWHRGAGAEREVDVINPRHISAGQDRLPDLRPLLRCQVCAAARLALLRLALLPLLRCLTSLALLTLLALRGLIRGLTALSLVRLRGLLAAILLHPLIALALRSLFPLSLGGLARGLALLPSLRLALLRSLRGLLGLTALRGRLRLLALGGTGGAAALLASALHALG
ncbi:MAG TPA: hypothetical protein VFQ33_10565 [Xanthobacteraceae bacterium]|nr:hypothetical protein [Xanthobacteraceae bacterium]